MAYYASSSIIIHCNNRNGCNIRTNMNIYTTGKATLLLI